MEDGCEELDQTEDNMFPRFSTICRLEKLTPKYRQGKKVGKLN
jgi:hypothetical protein